MNMLNDIRRRAFWFFRSLPPRMAAAVAGALHGAGRPARLLFGAIVHGLVIGGHLDYDGSPWRKLPGQIASSLGFAADDIRITGLDASGTGDGAFGHRCRRPAARWSASMPGAPAHCWRIIDWVAQRP